MAEGEVPTELLACPRCERALTATEGGHGCAGCRVEYPLLDGIPWLFAEPGAALGEWRTRMHFVLTTLRREAQQMGDALGSPGLMVSTRKRLELMRAAKQDHAQLLAALLAPLDTIALTAEHATHLALRTRLPPDQGLTTYYGNLHRDWCWGTEENEASLAVVREAAAGKPLGTTLVLGSGGGRLAYDVHMRGGAAMTVALDFNPLLVFAAERIRQGETVALYEFPMAPRQLSDCALRRDLAAEEPARDGLSYVLADALRPPFAAQRFDTVITPWLVDILPGGFASFAQRVNRLLAENGRWINFGSLNFHSRDPADQYSLDECLEAVQAAGFGALETAQTELPYLCSPASRHGRRELVLSWSASKTRKAGRPPRYEALPDWLVEGKDPVPLLDAFKTQALSTRIHAFIMSLIDGKRSLRDIADVLAENRLMQRSEAEASLRAFLLKMYDDSRRFGGY